MSCPKGTGVTARLSAVADCKFSHVRRSGKEDAGRGGVKMLAKGHSAHPGKTAK